MARFAGIVDGKTVAVMDYSHKRRADCEVQDDGLIKATQERLSRRVIPAIRQAFQFNATRIERHIVACYDAGDGGHFRAHRDNTTLGTAHRRFAVTLNLNADEFEGGELWFPEFRRRKYGAPTGGAVVFSCSLLHEATQVTRGTRYAFLPFLYDDATARARERNRQHLAGGPPIRGVPTRGEGARADRGKRCDGTRLGRPPQSIRVTTRPLIVDANSTPGIAT
jgi:predicted 2-oxoglutarate/Fe(II)-dependent dioxygenase YbiX